VSLLKKVIIDSSRTFVNMSPFKSRVRSALRWLRVLASTHTSVLMSDDKEALREKLSICLGVAEQRMNCLSEALQ